MSGIGWRTLLVMLSVGVWGCGPQEEAARDASEDGSASLQMIVSHSAWRVVESAEDDPFSASRPEDWRCDPVDGYGDEIFAGQLSFFVDTKLCPYITVEQESLAPIQRGDVFFLRVFHSELLAEPPAEAWLEVRVDGQVLWEARVAMPADASLLAPEVVADFDAPAGSRVVYHVENHGANAYHLLELARVLEGDAP